MTKSLEIEKLRRAVDPNEFPFETTEEIPPRKIPLGQERALRAIEFGLDVGSHGFNMFIVGPAGAGKRSTVTAALEKAAKSMPPPEDWVYVTDFSDEATPQALNFPAGKGGEFRHDIDELVARLVEEIPKAFSEESFGRAKAEIFRDNQENKSPKFEELEKTANEHGFIVQRSADGLSLIYTRDGEPLSPEEFQQLPEEEQERIGESRRALEEELRKTIGEIKEVDRETREAIKQLEKRVARAAVDHELEILEEKYRSHALVLQYLSDMENDVLEHIDKFRKDGEEKTSFPFPIMGEGGGIDEVVRRYRVNLFVNNAQTPNAPVIFESNPTYQNLIGRVEHRASYGTFVTDFTMIKPGALHQANGGFLILNAREVLMNPFAYDALKRVIKEQDIRMEEIGEQFRMISTATLKPEPIPARAKVVLLGTPMIYYLLQAYDEDFSKLFKVKGEFSDEMDLNEDNRMSIAFLISHHCAKESLLPFSRSGVARVIEQGLRMADSQKKISTHFLNIGDLVREAHYWAKKDGAATVDAGHVRKAVEEEIHRNNYVEEHLGELIDEGTIMIDTDGTRVGQINGLSVFDMGDYSFGKPTRLTARIYLGKEGVINIDREVDLSGRIHSKGVLILQGYFNALFAQKSPASFGATLCFEQSYGGIDGDSASSTELYCLISALAEIPLRQDIAVTGSVNQMGEVQAIGGVNEKIEGFFRTCRLAGLTGNQGVMIPSANVKHLMLSEEVLEAVSDGKFHVWAVSTIDEGLELLTGVEPGKPDDMGEYAPGTIKSKVVKRLERMNNYWKKSQGDY